MPDLFRLLDFFLYPRELFLQRLLLSYCCIQLLQGLFEFILVHQFFNRFLHLLLVFIFVSVIRLLLLGISILSALLVLDLVNLLVIELLHLCHLCFVVISQLLDRSIHLLNLGFNHALFNPCALPLGA